MQIYRIIYYFFIMAEVCNLDTCLGVILIYFHNDRGGRLGGYFRFFLIMAYVVI